MRNKLLSKSFYIISGRQDLQSFNKQNGTLDTTIGSIVYAAKEYYARCMNLERIEPALM